MGFKQQWIEALRSGRYDQVHEELHGAPALFTSSGEKLGEWDEDGMWTGDEGRAGYCCLGVAIRISGEEGNAGVVNSDNDGMPSEDFCDRHGFTYSQAEHLAGMNDGGSTFEEIAAWIEENVDG